jgi:hypothetical protein
MEIIGANGVPVGTVDKIEGSRIKLTKNSGRVRTRGIITSSAGFRQNTIGGIKDTLRGK